MTTVADIVRDYGPEYLDRFGKDLLPSHRKALRNIAECHTPAMGGHRFLCADCGKDHFQYHSCRNRSCTSCQSADREKWIQARLRDLLPCRYFHLVFTVPEELNRIIRSHQKDLLGVLMRSTGAALQILAADPKHLGGNIGVLEVLHTWGSNLEYHPHVHCLVPGGALRRSFGAWTSSRKKFFLSVRALSRLFRGRFLAMVRKQCPDLEIPQSVYDRDWVVFCKQAVQGPKKVLEYLGRYIHRTAISDGRIIRVANGLVTFTYKDYRTGSKKEMTLPAMEFLRRFLQHVLPTGFRKVRYLGLFSPSCRAEFRSLQLALWNRSGRSFPDLPPRLPKQLICHHCGSLNVSLIGLSLPNERPPPQITTISPDRGAR